MLKALIFLVTTGFCWVAVGAVVGLIGRRGLNLLYYQIICSALSLVISLSIGFFFPDKLIPPEGISASTWFWVIAGSLANGVFNYLMIKFMGLAMKKGPNAVVWATIQSGLIYPFFMGWLVFHEKMSACRIAGIVLIVASVILYAARGKASGKSDAPSASPSETGGVTAWLLPALLGMLCCGINQCGGNLPSYLERGQDFPSVFRALFLHVGGLLGCLGGILWGGFRGKWPDKPRKGELLRLTIYCASVLSVSYTANILFMFPGLDALKNLGRGPLGYPIMVCSCIIGFFPYGLFVLREKINPIQAVGAVVGIAGIILGCL